MFQTDLRVHGLAGLLALLVLFMEFPALAHTDSFYTRYSSFRIVDRGHHLQELVSDGREENWHPDWTVPGTENWRLTLESKIAWRPGTDVIVLGRLETSNVCWGRYQFIVVPREGLPWATEPSESCSFGPIAMRISHEKIELDTVVRRPDLAYVTIQFDGDALRELEVPRTDFGAEIAGAGPDVTRWVGAHIAGILDESSERLRFGTIMRPEDLYELVHNTYLMTSDDQFGLLEGVLVAWGCRPHNCGDAKGGIAIEVATGRPYAAICAPEYGLRVFGATREDLPDPMQEIVAQKCARWDGGHDPT